MLTVIIPALNEAEAIRETVDAIRSSLEAADVIHEIIVVNDGSTDETANIAREAGASVINHPAPAGYGRSLKDGIRAAKHDMIGITDADGTYPNERLVELYKLVHEKGFDMAVGARTGKEYRGTFLKMPARRVFVWLSEYAAGAKIDDINSGLRVFRKSVVLKYFATISNGFSFTTTITLAHLLNGHFVKYIPIPYYKRKGHSHVRYVRDSMRSLQIIIENILYYNSLKLFLLITNTLFIISGVALAAAILMHAYNEPAVIAAIVAGTAFVSAFLVGAIGLAADLIRQAIIVATDTAKDSSAPPSVDG